MLDSCSRSLPRTMSWRTAELPATGPMLEASSTTRRRPFSCGSTRRITSAASPCRMGYYSTLFCGHELYLIFVLQGNVKEVFERWAKAINNIEESLKKANYSFAYNDHLGYITTCPSNVGTGLRASVMLKLPKVCSLLLFF